MLKEKFQQALQQPMDRKNFLKHVGVGMIALTGVTAIASSVLGKNAGRHLSLGPAPADGPAYGASAYGGNNVSISRKG